MKNLLVGLLALGGLACAVEDAPVSRLRRGPPAEGTADAHDPDDVDGANASDPGNPNASSAPGAPTTGGVASAQFALTLGQATPTVGLGEETVIDVTVASRGGFTGLVDVSVTGLPPGATASSLRVAAGGVGRLAIRADVTAVPSAPNTSSAIVVTGTAGGARATANASFKIAPRLTLRVPVNVDALRAASTIYRDAWGPAFGQSQQALRTQVGNGIVVSVFNADSKAHVLHGENGFAHGDDQRPIQPNDLERREDGAPRTRTLNVGTDANGYLHDGAGGSGASFRIRVDRQP